MKKKPRRHGKKIKWKVFKKTGGKCFYCNCKLQNYNSKQVAYMTIDHVIPLAKGGLDTFDNMVPACQACNELKRDLWLDDFLQQRRKIMRKKIKLKE